MSSVRVFWPDSEAIRSAANALASEFLARGDVLGVYLCGSWARGDHTVASDVDILVVVQDDSELGAYPAPDRVTRLLPDRFPCSLDLFVYTAGEAERSPFAQGLLRDAVALPAPPAQGPNSPAADRSS